MHYSIIRVVDDYTLNFNIIIKMFKLKNFFNSKMITFIPVLVMVLQRNKGKRMYIHKIQRRFLIGIDLHIYGGQEVPYSVICKLVWRPKKAGSSISQSKGLRTRGEPCVYLTAPRLKKQELRYPGVGDGHCSSRRERILPLPFCFLGAPKVLDDAHPHL